MTPNRLNISVIAISSGLIIFGLRGAYARLPVDHESY